MVAEQGGVGVVKFQHILVVDGFGGLENLSRKLASVSRMVTYVHPVRRQSSQCAHFAGISITVDFEDIARMLDMIEHSQLIHGPIDIAIVFVSANSHRVVKEITSLIEGYRNIPWRLLHIIMDDTDILPLTCDRSTGSYKPIVMDSPWDESMTQDILDEVVSLAP